MSSPETVSTEQSPLAAYKAILRAVIENRPSGTRQRLAEALGKNRSFISQIISPAYATPVPVQHLETIFHVCHFAPPERQAFLNAYRAAHPGRLEQVDTARPMRRLVVELPDFGSSDLNARADHIVLGVARGLVSLVPTNDDEDSERRGGGP
ncbi:hypothetical protein B6S44_01140 [Bosea sp. Tri-44]|uniref:hypothetical protein n=1 Tax=Bosea sp. Tri-44 TaxID=1972137 RepID=UPI00100FF345|nr:hypothetical protein [Bosea sp. Tri-44]RXT57081.1 hypothetical protein B6S44_01140 [Bosea sp. Tri-44]